MRFTTVFEAPNYDLLLFPALSIMFFIVGATVIRRSRSHWSYWIVITVAVAAVIAFVYRDYRKVTTALKEGQYLVVEGPVEDIFEFPSKDRERFTVDGKRFSYSSYEITAGFNTTAAHGGPIHQGANVRVSYLGNLILRLEVEQDSNAKQ
jgi:hypothetical protein